VVNDFIIYLEQPGQPTIIDRGELSSNRLRGSGDSFGY
jgi:hypothetical protein